jgi:hypothetical protein
LPRKIYAEQDWRAVPNKDAERAENLKEQAEMPARNR